MYKILEAQPFNHKIKNVSKKVIKIITYFYTHSQVEMTQTDSHQSFGQVIPAFLICNKIAYDFYKALQNIYIIQIV